MDLVQSVQSAQNYLDLGLPFSWGLAALGAAIGIGIAVSAALKALGRQPEMFGKILILMILGCALVETIMLYVIMLTYPLISKI